MIITQDTKIGSKGKYITVSKIWFVDLLVLPILYFFRFLLLDCITQFALLLSAIQLQRISSLRVLLLPTMLLLLHGVSTPPPVIVSLRSSLSARTLKLSLLASVFFGLRDGSSVSLPTSLTWSVLILFFWRRGFLCCWFSFRFTRCISLSFTNVAVTFLVLTCFIAVRRPNNEIKSSLFTYAVL